MTTLERLLLLPACAAALFLGSFLLFAFEPMIGRRVLPVLGGSPSVWGGCLLFFQSTLLCGYLFAHGIAARPGRAPAYLLLLMLTLGGYQLLGDLRPLPPAGAAEAPLGWLLEWLASSTALTFVALSACAPLIQAIFSRSSHTRAGDPYFLYVASNAGSLTGLLMYPSVIEPNLGLSGQLTLVRAGFGMLIAAAALAALTLRPELKRAAGEGSAGAIAPASLAGWIGLSALPSSLTLSLTAFITSDIAPVPLLWIVPLAIYLVTFMIAFSDLGAAALRACEGVFPWLAIVSAPFFAFTTRGGLVWAILLHLTLFFVTACLCHGRLAASRPPAAQLTRFYLCLALGGALGGAFNILLAPIVFDSLIEYPLAYSCACLALPLSAGTRGERLRDLLYPAGLAGWLAAVALLRTGGQNAPELALPLAFAPAALACLSFKHRPARLALALAALVLCLRELARPPGTEVLESDRNFFGAKEVRLDTKQGSIAIVHGSTVHGLQRVAPARSPEPLGYYHPYGPAGDIFGAFGRDARGRAAVIGLGAGSMAAYIGPDQRLTFYEIDPLVVALAKDQRYFSHLASAAGRVSTVTGDGRLEIAREPGGGLGLVLVDAFNSDAIPVHLLTREAIELYLGKLAPGGLLAFHITNQYLDLEPVLAATLAELGLRAAVRRDPGDPAEPLRFESAYLAASREAEVMEDFITKRGWRSARRDPEQGGWSDDRSNVLEALYRGQR